MESNFQKKQEVRIISGKHAGKIGIIVDIEENKGFRQYSYNIFTIKIENDLISYKEFEFVEKERTDTFDKKMLPKQIEISPTGKKASKRIKKEAERKVTDGNKSYCAITLNDLTLHSPIGHNNGDTIMNNENQSEVNGQVEEAVAPATVSSVMLESSASAVQHSNKSRAGRKPDPNSAYSQAARIMSEMPNASRKEVVAELVARLGLKDASASVYFYNIKTANKKAAH